MSQSKPIPVIFLRARSSPSDAYESCFAASRDSTFDPIFVPVLHHCFNPNALSHVKKILRDRNISSGHDCAYGGLIFTSQRAVEAFEKVIREGPGDPARGDSGNDDKDWPHLQDVPVYSVGPATTRALKAIPQLPPLNIYGEHTGTGELLAKFILSHYGKRYSDRSIKPPLLFLAGEVRRDIIPKTLMDPALPVDERIEVQEVVVYETRVMASFEQDLTIQLERTKHSSMRWIVVFSPSGCDGMLRGMGLLRAGNTEEKQTLDGHRRSTFVATIGTTTQDHLVNKFDFKPDVCATKPSPEGVLHGILHYISTK